MYIHIQHTKKITQHTSRFLNTHSLHRYAWKNDRIAIIGRRFLKLTLKQNLTDCFLLLGEKWFSYDLLEPPENDTTKVHTLSDQHLLTQYAQHAFALSAENISVDARRVVCNNQLAVSCCAVPKVFTQLLSELPVANKNIHMLPCVLLRGLLKLDEQRQIPDEVAIISGTSLWIFHQTILVAQFPLLPDSDYTPDLLAGEVQLVWSIMTVIEDTLARQFMDNDIPLVCCLCKTQEVTPPYIPFADLLYAGVT